MTATNSGANAPKPGDDSIATRESLLWRLKNTADEVDWREFFDIYWNLIYRVARKAGLSDAEAQDVVQETVISVAQRIEGFVYDPQVCSFKTWMLRLTRWRISDRLEARQREAPACTNRSRPAIRRGPRLSNAFPTPLARGPTRVGTTNGNGTYWKSPSSGPSSGSTRPIFRSTICACTSESPPGRSPGPWRSAWRGFTWPVTV